MRGYRETVLQSFGILLLLIFQTVFAGWSRTDGLGTGQILAIASQDNTVFAGLSRAGIFRSDDRGENWEEYSKGLPQNTTITALCIVGSTILAGTEAGIYYSEDNGERWTTGSAVLENMHIRSFSSGGDDLVYAGTHNGGVFRSEDGGKSWRAKNGGLEDICVQTVECYGSNVYAGTQSCLYKSNNKGDTWKLLKQNSSMFFTSVLETGEMLYAGTSPIISAGSLGITCSEDGGETWATADKEIKYKLVRDLHSNGSVILAATWGSGIYKSENSGASWQPFTNGLTCSEINAVTSDGNTFYAATDGGVFRWSIGETGWALKSTGITKLWIRAVTGYQNVIYAGTERDGVFFSVDNGMKWQQDAEGLTSDRIYSITVNEQAVFVGTDSMGVFRRVMNENRWGAVGSDFPALPVVDLTAVGTTIFAENTLSIYRSNNNGDEWNLYKNDLPAGAGTAFTSKNGVLFTGGDDGVYTSKDNGITWTAANSGMEGIPVISMAVAGNTLYAGTFLKGVYRSTDNGATWEAVTPNWSYSIEEMVPVGENIFGLSRTNVFVSDDNGDNWENVHTGIESTQFISLGANNRTLFVGTRYDGVWQRPLADMVNVGRERATPGFSGVSVRAPSGKNTTMTVFLELAHAQPVQVVLYTAGGRCVGLLADRVFTAGNHAVSFNTQGCAPGCYLLKLKTGGSSQNRRVTFLR